MFELSRILVATLLTGAFVLAYPEHSDSHQVSLKEYDTDTSLNALSGEDLSEHHLDLEDVGNLNADEDYTEYRKKRSLDATAQDDLIQNMDEATNEPEEEEAKTFLEEEMDTTETVPALLPGVLSHEVHHHLSSEEDGKDTSLSTQSGEDVPEHHLDGYLSANEAPNEDYSGYRRRRSVDATASQDVFQNVEQRTITTENKPEEGKISTDFSKEDMETAETAIFMPAHLRLKKKRAIEECREKNRVFVREHRANPLRPARWLCNDYCCYCVTL